MRNLIILICFIGILTSCEEERPHLPHVHRLRKAITQEMKNEESMEPFMAGGEFFYDIQKISLGYMTDKQLKLAEGRRIAVKFTERVLNKVNGDVGIRPYLHEYPFPVENLDLEIAFQDKSGKYMPEPYLASIYIVNGVIVYNMHDAILDMVGKVYAEPYEDALRLVK